MFGASQTPFGSSAGGGFGQPANPTPGFGSPAPAPFGQAPAAGGFGGSSFGAPAPAPGGFGGGFGAAPAPGGFGAAPTPAFGAAPAPATGFGAPSPGFGAPASSPFGAPAPAAGGLFGSAPAPASGGLFGSAPAPAPGGFGAAPAPGGFGGFGASSTPAFGAPAPAAGMFGSAPAPATGGLFGSAPAPAPGGFGSSMGGFGGMGASTTPGFGAPAPATGGLFGAPAPAAPVGGVFGSSAGAAPGAGGTKIAPYQPTTRQDGTNQITLHSISAIQQYSQKNFEELRLEDYTQGNKGTGAAQAGGFGAPSGFGAPAPAPTTGLFGSAPVPATGAFGAAPAPAAFGAFGAPAAAPGAFGAPSPAAPGFGSPAAATGAFGAPAAPAFGASPAAFGAKPPGTGLFGAPAPAPATGGLFGAPAPAPASGGLFGAPAAPSAFGAAPAPGGNLFGAPAPAPGGLFGAPAATPGFGAAPAPTAFGGFGAAPAPTTGGLFGSAPAPAGGGLFGAPAAPSLFGAPAPAPVAGGLFGAPAAAPVAQYQVAAPYAAPPLGAVMPPAANEIMASQLAALDSKRKEMEQNDNFRNKPSESSSVKAISLSERESRRNMIGPVTPARISSYRASPMSNAKLRPRGFASPPSDTALTNIPQSLSRLGTGGKPMAAPETVAASSATRLIIAPSPKPKLKLTLGGGEKKILKSAAATTPRKMNNGLGSVQNSSVSDIPQGVSTPKDMSMNGSSSTPSNGGLDRAQQYYQEIIGSPNDARGTPGITKKQAGVPTLSKEGYSCHPSIDTLQQMDSADLAAVSNFSITRNGVGRVAWEGAVDVRGANLDRIVVIESKSVSIYTEEEEEGRKPEVGTKLNRSAVLTLENVYPPDPSAPEKFAKKVARQTMKMDAELISYDPSSGEWILRVQHFSRYALDDDSDDDEDIENKKPGTPELQENTGKGKVDFSLGEREGRSPVSRKDGMNKMTRHDTPYKMQGLLVMGEESEEEENDVTMKVYDDIMTESTVMDEAETAFNQMQMSLQAENVIRAVKKKMEKDTALFTEESQPSAEDKGMLGNRRYIPDLQDFRTAASMPSFSSKLAKSKSISTSKSSSTDFGLRMGRSFRVGWSPNGSFFSVGKNGVLIRSKPKLEKIDVPRELKLLETHRSYVQKTKTEGNCPVLYLSPKTGGNSAIKDTLESYSAAVKDTSGTVSSVFDSAYSLLQVLHESKTVKESNIQAIAFGTANQQNGRITDNECLLSITRWFINSCREEVGHEIMQARAKQNKYKALLSAVSGGDLSKAAKIAEEENLFQLSILLASGPESREDIFQEIMTWRKAGNAYLISDELSRTYRLIAGDLGMEEDVYKQSNKGSNTFDWRRRMVMNLMFSKPEKACKSLSSAIAQYESDVAKGLAPFPSSHYSNDDIESTLFRLLRLGTQTQVSDTELSLSDVVDPLGYTDDPNNFSLSFHLTSCITSIYASVSLSPEEEYTLLDGYAFQLQSLGLWEWAVYVFLCVLSNTTHTSSVWRIQRAKSLVLQNYFDDDNVNARKRKFLEKLGLPSDWFEEASCYRSFSTGDTYGYIAHSLNLDPEKASKVLERTLVPNILFIKKEGRDSILQIFEGLSSKMEQQSLVSAIWTFFAIYEEIEGLERCSQAEIDDSVPDLMETCEEIQQILSSYKASEEKLVDNGLDIVPANYLVPLGSFLAEALHQTSHFKLQLLALKEGMGISNTASQMLNLLKSQAPSDYSIRNRENVCRWLM